jgi:RHS repeat-associated protein
MRRAGLRKGVLAIVLLVVLGGLGLAPREDAGAVVGAPTSDAKVVKELTQLRTENSETFLLADGRRQAVIYGGSIHYQDQTGAWQKIDTTLIPADDPGEFVSRATPVAVRITSGEAPAVFLTYRGHSLSMTLVGAQGSLLSPAPESTTTQEDQASPEKETTSSSAPAGPTSEATTTTAETTTTAATESPTSESTTTTAESTTTTAETSTTGTTAPGPGGDRAPTAALAAAVSGSTATFARVLPEVGLSYEVTAGGVKENLILASAAAPPSFTFTISHPGLILHEDPQGQWGFYDEWENPHPLLVMPAPVAYDSSRDDLGDPAFCPNPGLTVRAGKDESTVTLSLPESWMSDPARIYPVTLDPSVHNSYASIDTFISSGTPNDYFYSLDHVSAGNFGSPNYWVTGLFKFTLPADLTNAYVHSAQLYLRQYYQSTSTAQVARISAMTEYWIGSSTYNSLGGKTWFGSETLSLPTTSSQGQNLTFQVEPIVKKWADGTLENHGFALYQSEPDHSQRGWYRRVYSYNYSNSAYWPKLTITYSLPIDATTSPYNADKTGTNDATAAIASAISAAESNGGVVYLPAGNYKVSNLTIARSNLVLRGSGDSTRLIVSSPEQACTLQIGGSTAVSNVTVKDLYVRVPAGGDGIRLQGTGGGSNITLTNLSLGGGADSSEHQAIVVGSNFTDLTLSGNDLTGVSARAWDFSASAAQATVFANSLSYEPYRADFFGDSDPYQTAIRLSRAAFPAGIDAAGKAAVVALGTSYPNALCAGPLAKAYGGPLLLNPSTSVLDADVKQELGRLKPPTIFLVGLPDALVTAVKDALPAATVTKLTGADVNATATAVAGQIKTKLGSVGRVTVVPSDDFDDAVAAGAIAAKNGWPILFTPKDGPLPSATSSWYTSNMSTPRALEVGTTVTLTGISTGNIQLINGSDAYETAGLVADWATTTAGGSLTYASTALATASSWPDAVLAGAYVGKDAGILLLTNAGTIPSATETRLRARFAALDYLTYLNLPGLFAADQNPGKWVPGAPRHTTYDLGGFAEHGFEATLDQSALEAQTTDLEIASLGPRAALDRHYSSTRTTAGYFAPGWRFGFERKLDLSQQAAGRIDYVDEEGETYSFVGKTGTDGGIGLPVQTSWTAPPGFTATLRKEPYSYWKLSLPGGNTLTFSGDGKLASEEDANLNMTQYTWTAGGDPERIYAQNGQQIALTVVNHKLTGASYSTAAGTRTVTYAAASPWTVTYSYSGTPATASRSLTYGYASNLLTTLTPNSFAGGQNATETFTYTASALTAAYFPDYDAGANPDARAQISYGAGQATITTYGRIYSPGAATGTPGTALTQTFTWNPSGTMASKTNPKTAAESTQTWTYTYTPLTNYLMSETSPLGRTRSFTYNMRGNLTSETDELGRTTTWTYPDRDPLVHGVIQTYVAYNEDDVYNANSTLRTDRLYQAIGRGTAVDSAGWRFRNLEIPKGATITSARLYLAAYYVPNGDMELLSNRFGAEAGPNPGVWAAGTHEPRVGYSQLTSDGTVGLSLRPEDENGDLRWVPPEYSQSHDFRTSVQEVVAGPGWAPGNSLCVVAQDAGTPAVNLINCYDSSGGKPAILRIAYGLELDPDPKWDQPTTKTDPRGNKTYYSYDKRGNLIEVKRELNPSQAAVTRYLYRDLDTENYGFLRVLRESRSLLSGAWTNRFSQVSEFDHSSWVKTRSAVFANVLEGPLGREVSADKLVENNQTGTHSVGQTVSVQSGTTYRVSVYVQASERYQAAISFPSAGFGGGTAVFDIAEGAGVLSSTCQSAGIDYMLEEGWYQMWAEKTATATTSATITLGTALNGSTSYTGTGQATPRSSDPGIYLWGAECVDVSTPVALTTTYDCGGYWPNGEPKEIRTRGVALEVGGTPVDLAVSQTYDAFGNLLSKTDSAGQTTETNTYDLAGRLLTQTGPSFTATPLAGSATSTQVTRHRSHDPWGHVTESYATSSGEPAPQTKADWVTTTYDKAGRPSQIKTWLSGSPPPSGPPESTKTLTYDGLGRLIQTADTTVSGLPALSAYDARGNVVVSWLGGACTGSYDLAKATRSINADGTPAYDALSRVLKTAPPGDDPTVFTYTDDNRLLRETKPDGSWTEYTYDEVGNITHTKTSKSSPDYLTTSLYDYAGRLTSHTDGNNLTTTYTYDLLGRRVAAGAQGQSASTYTYNALGWQLEIQDADGFATGRLFDQAGRVTLETTASYTTTFTYQTGASGLLSQKDEADTHRTTLTYDFFGRANREVQVTTSPSATYKDTALTYDSLGRVLTSTDDLRRLTHSFTYPQNTATSTTDTYTVGASGSDLIFTTLTIGADGLEASRASTITSSPQVPDVTRSITTRDDAKRVTKASLQTGTSRFIYSQYAFDSAGRIQKQWGTSGGGSGYTAAAETTTAYTYDSASGLKTADNLQLISVGTAGVISSSYTYTASGRLATATTNGVTETYTFDPAGNLTSIGPGTSLTYQENRLQTMTQGGSTTYFFFDAQKRWRTVQAPTNNESDPNRTAYAYTGTGRLATWTKYVGGSPSVTASYTYDASGQRTRSVVAVTGGLTTSTDFAYQGLLLQSLSASQQGEGASSWRLTYLYDEYGKPYAGVYRSPASSTSPVVFALLTTDRGDVVSLLDAEGNPFAAYRYDAWGNPQGQGNVATGVWSQATGLISSQLASDIARRQPLRYASYCYDSESGLYYLSARSYDPKTRQFLSKDLSRNDGEQSAYQYCGGNPVKYVDPSGYRLVDERREPTHRAPWFRQWLAWYTAYAPLRANYQSSIVRRSAPGSASRRATELYKQRNDPGLSFGGGKKLDFPSKSNVPMTNQLMTVLVTGAGRVRQQMADLGVDSASNDPKMLAWFCYQVANYKVWDFKRGVPDGLRTRPYMKFDYGKGSGTISPEQFGNFHLGFVGHAAELDADTLVEGSMIYHRLNAMSPMDVYPGSPQYLQELGDERWIREGWSLYHQMYPAGSAGPAMTYDYYHW